MISIYLDDLVKAYPNRNKFYSLDYEVFSIKDYKILRSSKMQRQLVVGTNIKELFELACETYAIDGISEDGSVYYALNIYILTDFKSKNLQAMPSASKYARNLRQKRRYWYCYQGQYLTDDELVLKIIDKGGYLLPLKEIKLWERKNY